MTSGYTEYEEKEFQKMCEAIFPGKKSELVKEFAVLWSGWECDSVGYVVKVEGIDSLQLLMSNHGFFDIVKDKNLQERISEYEEVLAASREALSLLVDSRF